MVIKYQRRIMIYFLLKNYLMNIEGFFYNKINIFNLKNDNDSRWDYKLVQWLWKRAWCTHGPFSKHTGKNVRQDAVHHSHSPEAPHVSADGKNDGSWYAEDYGAVKGGTTATCIHRDEPHKHNIEKQR